MKISRRAASIEPSMIREIRAHKGPNTLDLGLGQGDLPVTQVARDAAAAAILSGPAPYGPNLGDPDARRAVAARYGLSHDNVMITCGVQQALGVAALGLLEPGAEVLVPDPGFPAYPNLVRLAGATPVTYPLLPGRGWAVDLDAFESAITARTRACILCSPSNPTGSTLTQGDAQAVAGLLGRHGIWCISDEIYEDYLYDVEHVSVFDLMPGQSVKVSGMSKTHHAMGWRLGWMLGPPGLIEALKPLHQHLVTSASTVLQRALPAALASHTRTVTHNLEVFRERRDAAISALREMPGVTCSLPSGAFYAFPDVSAWLLPGESTLAMCQALLAQEDVLCVPGTGFGPAGEGHLRLAYTVDLETLRIALGRMHTFASRRADRP